METKVLIIEDDKHLADALCQILRHNGYESDIALDGIEGLKKAMSIDYDAVILDIMLPGLDGFEILEQIRKTDRNTPVIMLTARDKVKDKVSALDKGADDYLTKPFETEELLARLRVMIRRNADPKSRSLSFGDLILDIDNHLLFCGERHIKLSCKEFEIIRILLSNPNMIISKEMLISRIWGDDSDVIDNNVEVYISFLRKKIDFMESGTKINTVRKVGYRLEK